jgi:hypothetical protein
MVFPWKFYNKVKAKLKMVSIWGGELFYKSKIKTGGEGVWGKT